MTSDAELLYEGDGHLDRLPTFVLSFDEPSDANSTFRSLQQKKLLFRITNGSLEVSPRQVDVDRRDEFGLNVDMMPIQLQEQAFDRLVVIPSCRAYRIFHRKKLRRVSAAR